MNFTHSCVFRGVDSATTNFPVEDYTAEIPVLAAKSVEQNAAEARAQAAESGGYVARSGFSRGKTLSVAMMGPTP